MIVRNFSRLKKFLEDLVSDAEDAQEPGYDPVHLAGVLVGTLVALGVLFWLLWTLLVYQGGIFKKIPPFLSVLFTSKTLADYGYEGYPYELGVFEGFIGNTAALLLTLLFIYLLWKIHYQFLLRSARN